jgi:hypothetical protein
MGPKKKTIVYEVKEDFWWKYITKIENDRKITTNLLFESPENSLPLNIETLLCEYHALLGKLEELLDEMDDPEFFVKERKSFLVSEIQGMEFSLLLSALVIAKEKLQDLNYSMFLH